MIIDDEKLDKIRADELEYEEMLYNLLNQQREDDNAYENYETHD